MPKLIPFYLLPASWGLKGLSREEAQASYELEGYDLDRKMAEIRYKEDDELKKVLLKIDLSHGRISQIQYEIGLLPDDLDVVGRAKAILAIRRNHDDISHRQFDEMAMELDFPKTSLERKIAQSEILRKYGEISDYDHEIVVAKLKFPPKSPGLKRAILEIDFAHDRITEYDLESENVRIDHPKETNERCLALLEVDHRHGKVKEFEYQKEKATLNEEPWIDVIDHGFNPDQGVNGVYFEFDWNDHWIIFLRSNGYRGATDAEVIDHWFADVCRANGTGLDDGKVVPFSGMM